MRRILIALVTAATIVACGSTTDVSSSSVVGTYTVISLNGQALPAKTDSGQTVSAASLAINANDTYVFTQTIAGVTESDSGSYVLSGNNITFTPSTQGHTGATGVFDGTTLTVQAVGDGTLVLHKN